jgi:hypothetical protein
MAYASSPLVLAIDQRIFDIPLEERFHGRTQGRTSDQLGPRQCYQPSPSALASHRTNFVAATKTSVLYHSEIGTQRSLPRPRRPPSLPQTASELAEPTFDSDLNRQETSPLRLQPTFSNPDITTSVITSLALQLRQQPRTRPKSPRKKRQLPQTISSLVVAPFSTVYSHHDHR